MNVNEFYAKLETHIKSRENDRIEAYLLSSLKEGKDKEDYGSYIVIGNEMISFYRSILQYKKAFDAAEDILLLMEELQLENSEHFASVLLNTAAAYQEAGETGQAYKYCQQALGIYKGILPEDDCRLAGLYNNMSAMLEQMDRNEEAAQTMQQALTIIKTGSDTAEEAAALTSLGLIYFKLNKNEEAKQAFKQALQIFEQLETGRERGTYYSTALAGMGEAFYRTKDYGSSLVAYEKALDEVKKHFGENQSYAVLCENCAAVCECLQDMEKAKRFREKARQACSAYETVQS